MHVSTKDVDKDGVHILTNLVEGDGPNPIASDKAKLEAKVISVSRTESGGVQVQTALSISEPEVVAPKLLSEDDVALEYLASKGITGDEAKEDLAKFGASRILAQKSSDEAAKQADLDEQLKAKLG